MNAVAIRFLVAVLALVVLSFLFAWFFKREFVRNVDETISWLLKVSYLDFVQLIIFIKPLKNHALQVGVLLWLVLVFVTGRYLIITQPKITEIAGPYIPMIGYIFYLSALFIVHYVLRVSGRTD